MPTVNEVIALRSPDFVGDSRIPGMDEIAKMYVSSRMFKDKWTYARALIILHWLTLDARGGGSSTQSGSGVVGNVIEEKEGKLEYKYGSILTKDDKDGYYKSTSFGAELLQLYRICILAPRTRWV